MVNCSANAARFGFTLCRYRLRHYGALAHFLWCSEIVKRVCCIDCDGDNFAFFVHFRAFYAQKKVLWYEVALGLVIVPAMIFVAGTLPEKMTLGLCVGLTSALLQTVFSILNKKMVTESDPLSITLLELGGGWLFLCLCMPFYFYFDKTAVFLPPSVSDWFYLMVLAFLCTNLAFWLGIRTLRHLSAFATNLTINLEPVYGILLAVLILKENKELSPSFYIGAAVILAAVLSHPLLKSKFEK